MKPYSKIQSSLLEDLARESSRMQTTLKIIHILQDSCCEKFPIGKLTAKSVYRFIFSIGLFYFFHDYERCITEFQIYPPKETSTAKK